MSGSVSLNTFHYSHPFLSDRMGGEEGQRVRGGALGLGLLLGGAVFAHGLQCGAVKAEILAINDDGESCLMADHFVCP